MEDNLVETRVGTARQEAVELDEKEEVRILAFGCSTLGFLDVVILEIDTHFLPVPGDVPSPSLPMVTTPTCSDDLLRPDPYPSPSNDARNISFICFNFSSTSASRVSIGPALIDDDDRR